MTSIQSSPRGCTVGALACQKDSYLQTLIADVVSCVKAPPPQQTAITNNHDKNKNKNKNNNDNKNVGTAKSSSKPVVVATKAIAEADLQGGSRSSTDQHNPGNNDDLWMIEFTDSVLFPEGGGQPTDHGTITSITDSSSSSTVPITFVQRDGLRCIYHSPVPLEPGTKVRQDIDFRRRWDHMQQHTGQHLLSGIMDNHFNDLKTLGWGMGAGGEGGENEMNYVELPRKPSAEEIEAIQHKCNEAIRSNLRITVKVPQDAKIDKLPDDYDKEEGVVRVVDIESLGPNTCCGTHLSQASHISLILLHHTQTVRSTNCRLYFTAGDRAINLATASIQSLRSIGTLTSSSSSSNPHAVLDSVTRLNDTCTELKRTQRRLLTDVAKYEADLIKAALISKSQPQPSTAGDGEEAVKEEKEEQNDESEKKNESKNTIVKKQQKNGFLIHRAEEGMEFINMVLMNIKKDIILEYKKDEQHEHAQEGFFIIFTTGEYKKQGGTGGQIVVFSNDATTTERVVERIKKCVDDVKGGSARGERWQGKAVEWKKGELEALEKLVQGW